VRGGQGKEPWLGQVGPLMECDSHLLCDTPREAVVLQLGYLGTHQPHLCRGQSKACALLASTSVVSSRNNDESPAVCAGAAVHLCAIRCLCCLFVGFLSGPAPAGLRAALLLLL
jgi:hypothetical protein